MAQTVAATSNSQSIGKMPETIHALLADIANIRLTILTNAPGCLPQIAPALIHAEDQVNSLWRN
jgi:hypothetical protein